MISSENNRAILWNIFSTNNLHLLKKDSQHNSTQPLHETVDEIHLRSSRRSLLSSRKKKKQKEKKKQKKKRDSFGEPNKRDGFTRPRMMVHGPQFSWSWTFISGPFHREEFSQEERCDTGSPPPSSWRGLHRAILRWHRFLVCEVLSVERWLIYKWFLSKVLVWFLYIFLFFFFQKSAKKEKE